MRLIGKYLFLITSVVLIALNLGAWIHDNSEFAVRKILVSGTSLLDPTQIVESVQDATNEHIMEADVRQIEKRLARIPQVKFARVSRVFPSSLRVEIEERNPVALVIDNGIWGIDEDGILLPKFNAKHGLDYPVIVNEKLKNHNTGEKIENEQVRELVEFLSYLKNENAPVYSLISEISTNEIEGVRLLTMEKSIPIVLGKDRLLEKCRGLSTAWQFFTSKDDFSNIKYLDLRYHDQIIAKKRV